MRFVLVQMPRIIFGRGARDQLGAEAAALGERALLVTGGASLGRARQHAALIATLEASGVSVERFDPVPPEPTVSDVERGRVQLSRSGADLVVGVGGGSAMDVAKAIGGLAGCTRPLAEFVGGPEVGCSGLPIICLPTTAGTGAEVTRNSVITDQARRVKASIRGDALTPAVAIVDPELTHSAPPPVTAASGLDALSQALEALVSRGASPVTDGLALEATAALGAGLRRAYHDGDDAEARELTSLGSLLAGMALASARLGLVHGMAHPIGHLCAIPHGEVCAALLPHVLRFNLDVTRSKYALAAARVGSVDSAEALLEWVDELCADLGLPRRIATDSTADWEFIVEQTLTSGSTRSNPREVTREDVLRILAALG